MDKAAHLLQLFFLDELQRIEVFDLGGNLAGELGGVKVRNAAYPAMSRKQAFPHFFGGVSNCTDESNASDNDPTSQLLPAFPVLPDIIHGVLNGADFFRVLIGNFEFEGFLKSHDQFDGVERIGS